MTKTKCVWMRCVCVNPLLPQMLCNFQTRRKKEKKEHTKPICRKCHDMNKRGDGVVKGGWQQHASLSPDIQPCFDPVMGGGSTKEVQWSRGANLHGGAQTISLNLYPAGRSCLWPCQGISHTRQHCKNHLIAHTRAKLSKTAKFLPYPLSSTTLTALKIGSFSLLLKVSWVDPIFKSFCYKTILLVVLFQLV